MIFHAEHHLGLPDTQSLTCIHYHEVVWNLRPHIERRPPDALNIRNLRIGISNDPCVPVCPPPVGVTGLMLSPSLGAAWFAWAFGPPVGFCAEPHKPPTLPRARSGTSGPLPAPSPGNGIATHRPVHSSMDCIGGPRAPSGSSL